MPLRASWNVRDFGAIGDDATDDDAAIHAAIATAAGQSHPLTLADVQVAPWTQAKPDHCPHCGPGTLILIRDRWVRVWDGQVVAGPARWYCTHCGAEFLHPDDAATLAQLARPWQAR
jgi:Pectate lyase superfamily protein